MIAAKFLIAAGFAALAASAISCERSRAAASPAHWRFGTSVHNLETGGYNRSYLLHVPAVRPRTRLRRVTAFPVVLLLHGSGADGKTIQLLSNFDSLADANHFIVAYPNGTTGQFGFGSDWNAGECCGAAARNEVDDVAFLQAVIADISAHLPVNRRRLYVAGFSDGARMAYHFACQRARTVTAIGVVSGSLVDAHCSPALPVPAVIVHGTADEDVPISDPASTRLPVRPAADLLGLSPSAQFWAVQNGCRTPQHRAEAPAVIETVFRVCRGADLILYTIEGGTHNWPGGAPDGSNGAQPTGGFDASKALIGFFLKHSK